MRVKDAIKELKKVDQDREIEITLTDEESDIRECYLCGTPYNHKDLECGDLGICKKFIFGEFDVMNLCGDCKKELTEEIEKRRAKWKEEE